MTVIALLNHPETPVLLSDMLISTAGAKSEIFLPALGDLHVVEAKFGLQLPFTATRMARKPFPVGQASLVAWGGALSAGEALKRWLEERCINRHVTQEDLDTAYWEIPDPNMSDLSVICVSLPNSVPRSEWRENVVISSLGCVTVDLRPNLTRVLH